VKKTGAIIGIKLFTVTRMMTILQGKKGRGYEKSGKCFLRVQTCRERYPVIGTVRLRCNII
jgi:hypothetical protein